MPRGLRGEKRPADVIGNAVKEMRIATGEETEELETDRRLWAMEDIGALIEERSVISGNTLVG
jgi:hypothetical protein